MNAVAETAGASHEGITSLHSRPEDKRGLWSSLVAGLLAALPIWMTTYPPMVDLPQYAAQVAMFNHMMAGDWQFADLFGVELFTPYLSAFFLIWVIEPVAGMVTAVKVVVSLALFGMPFSTAMLVREFRGDPNWSWLVVPASYGFAFNWGFLNFLVAAPLGMLYLVAALRYARNPSLCFGLGMSFLTHLLFFSHVLPLFFFGALAGTLILLRASSLPRGIVAVLPLLSLAPVGLSWGLPSLGESQAQWPTIWDLRLSRVLDIPGLALGTQNQLGLSLLFLALFAIPLLGGARPTRRPERYLPLALCILVLMLVPNLMVGNYFTYHRFAIFAIPLYLVILDRMPADTHSRSRTLAVFGAFAVAIAWVGWTSLRFHGYERESADFRAMMTRIQPDQRVLSMVFLRQSQFSIAPIYLHYPVWYQAENRGLVDFNFATFQGEPVHYLPDRLPAAGPDFVWHPYGVEWSAHRPAHYRYLVARAGSGPDDSPLLVDDCDEYTLASKVGAWWLYNVDPEKSQDKECANLGQ